MTVADAKTLLNSFPNLEFLELRAYSDSDVRINKECLEIISQLEQLKSITFKECDLHSSYIEILSKHNSNLQILNYI